MHFEKAHALSQEGEGLRQRGGALLLNDVLKSIDTSVSTLVAAKLAEF